MTLPNETTFLVHYENRDGYHYFTSPDVKGLRVGSRDFDEAFEDVSRAIEILMHHNHNVKCKVWPEKTREEFLAREMLHMRGQVRPFKIVGEPS